MEIKIKQEKTLKAAIYQYRCTAAMGSLSWFTSGVPARCQPINKPADQTGRKESAYRIRIKTGWLTGNFAGRLRRQSQNSNRNADNEIESGRP
jgi:hypothetical protein